jgi:4-amino-4-deoxy-L-arabinose transferase-like glycosyltransferase
MKSSGRYYYYCAILALFGQTAAAIHLGLLLVNLSTIVLLFLLVKRMFGADAAVVAAASYGLLSVSPTVLGFAGHVTHFVAQCAVAGLLLLQISVEQKKWWVLFASGLCFGLASLMKQPGAFFVMFAGL